MTAHPTAPSFWRRTARLRLGRLTTFRNKPDPASLDELEEHLFSADFGVAATERLLRRVRSATDPAAATKAEVAAILRSTGSGELAEASSGPTVYLVVGVNGSGKTTSVAKLAHRMRTRGRSVLVAAADTFRAGAVEQLDTWARRVGADFVRGGEGADPAAVAFDAVEAARSRNLDAVIVDTAGRLHTNRPLMGELAKIERVIRSRQDGAPHETLMVLDATTGQNAVAQLDGFKRSVGVSGVILARMDSTARGGIIVAIAEEHGIGVKLIGTGESAGDMIPFVVEAFVEGMFANASPTTAPDVAQ